MRHSREDDLDLSNITNSYALTPPALIEPRTLFAADLHDSPGTTLNLDSVYTQLQPLRLEDQAETRQPNQENTRSLRMPRRRDRRD